MRKSRFTDEQIVAAVKEHEAGTPTQELCRRLGIGAQTLYRWKAKYGGMSVRPPAPHDQRCHPPHHHPPPRPRRRRARMCRQ